MDSNNWRPAQAEPPPPQLPPVDAGDWRSQLQLDTRQRIVDKIMETLKRHLPFSGPEGLQELKKIAVRFEEKIYTAATSQSDYLMRIALKMLTMETKSQNPVANSLPSKSVGNSNNLPDPASQSMQSQVHNQGQPIPLPLAANQSQARQQLLLQNIQNNIAAAGGQSSTGIQSALRPVTSLTQTPMLNVGSQNSNMQNISGGSQIHLEIQWGQGVPSNIFYNSQRQMQGRPQVSSQQQHQHSQNPQYLYQQQLQQQLLKQKLQQGNIQYSIIQSHIQQQQEQQQQLMTQENNLPNMHQPQLGSQSNASGPQQQQQLLETQSGNSGMQTNQHSLHMLQQPKIPLQQQAQQTASSLLQSQGQQPQTQPPQQQLMSPIQSQPAQLQQQLGLQQQQNPLQLDIQQRLQTSSALLQPQNVIDQQKQLFQSQRALPEASSTSFDSIAQMGHANGGDWQEEVYQKIKTMKVMYLPEINEMYQRIAAILQQHDAVPQQQKTDQLEKLKLFKTMLERIITFLGVSKSSINLTYKEKLSAYEKQIINFLNAHRLRKPVSAMQQEQLPPPHMHSLQQSQQAQPQNSQVQAHENQTNQELQFMNLQGFGATMQQNNMTTMQHGSISSLPVVPNAQQNMMNSMQPGTNLDSGQGSALSSLQQVAVGSLQQNPVSTPNEANINTLSSQGGINMLQPNINTLQSNPSMLQPQHLKQQQEQHMMQAQLKQLFQQRQMQQQQQQLHQQTKQQPPQLQAHQVPQLQQTNDGDLKIRQGMGVKSGVFQQHHAAGQWSLYQQQLKSGGSFPISSPQLIQAASPQITQHSSTQIDQQNMLSSLTKAGTPLQSAHSPFVVPFPPTPLAPSPMPSDPDKHGSGIFSLTNAGNIGHQQTSGAVVPCQSLAIGTPGISASPLLAEFSSQGGNHGNTSTIISGKSNVTEQPLECLIRAEEIFSHHHAKCALGYFCMSLILLLIFCLGFSSSRLLGLDQLTMDMINSRPAQAQPPPPPQSLLMDTGDWRSQLHPDSRERIVNKILETLKRHLPFSGQEGLDELKKGAVRFEEKIYAAASSQSDYLRKISLKMLTMETESQTPMANCLPFNSAGNSRNIPDPGTKARTVGRMRN